MLPPTQKALWDPLLTAGPQRIQVLYCGIDSTEKQMQYPVPRVMQLGFPCRMRAGPGCRQWKGDQLWGAQQRGEQVRMREWSGQCGCVHLLAPSRCWCRAGLSLEVLGGLSIPPSSALSQGLHGNAAPSPRELRVTGRKARGLQMEEIGCTCQTYFNHSLKWQEETTSVILFPSLYKFKKRFLLKFCVAITTPGNLTLELNFSQTLS